MNPGREHQLLLTRRHFFGRSAVGIGTAALASLLNERLFAADTDKSLRTAGGILPALHFAPKAKHNIVLFMPGGIAQAVAILRARLGRSPTGIEPGMRQ